MKGSQFIFESVETLKCFDKCFQYAITVALNYQNIKRNSERVTRITPFINQYGYKNISFRSHKKDWKKFESYNKSIALNTFFVPYHTEKNQICT